MRNVTLESDCREVVDAIFSSDAVVNWDADILHEIRALFNLDWVVDVVLCDREVNRAANAIANEA